VSDKDKDKDKKATAAERAWAVRRARTRRLIVRFAIFVGVPTLLAILYYGLWAADEYVSVSIVTVQSPVAGKEDIGGGFVQNRSDDSRLARDSISSRDALARLIETEEWRKHHASSGNMFSSLAEDAGSEKAYGYYTDRVKAKAGKGQALVLSVRAFSPEAAAKFSKALLGFAEERLNGVALRPLREQAAIAKERLASARKAMAAAPAAVGPEELEPPARTKAREGLARAEEQSSNIELALVARTRYLTIVSGPSVPTEAAYPRRMWSILTVLVVAFALMGVVSLLLGAVREHAKV